MKWIDNVFVTKWCWLFVGLGFRVKCLNNCCDFYNSDRERKHGGIDNGLCESISPADRQLGSQSQSSANIIDCGKK